MGRISRQVMFMDMCRSASRRATCHRLNVGAIVAHDNSPVSVGWNGAPSGVDHCAGNDCPGIVPGHCATLHAEDNALRKATAILSNRSVFDLTPSVDLYCTHSPCQACSDAVQGGWLHVKRLFFEIPYRSTQHLGMFANPTGSLSRQRITEVYEITAAGYAVDYFTRRVVELP